MSKRRTKPDRALTYAKVFSLIGLLVGVAIYPNYLDTQNRFLIGALSVFAGFLIGYMTDMILDYSED